MELKEEFDLPSNIPTLSLSDFQSGSAKYDEIWNIEEEQWPATIIKSYTNMVTIVGNFDGSY